MREVRKKEELNYLQGFWPVPLELPFTETGKTTDEQVSGT